MQAIMIDDEFKSLIPPLSMDERNGLEENLLRDGCREALVAWEGTLVDGHNRYEICTRLNIPYRTEEMQFDDRDAVLSWIISNQLGRRNLTLYDRTRLVLRQEDVIQARAKRKENIRKSTKQETAESPLPAITTRDELAKLAGVSHDTVAKVKVIEAKATEEQKADLSAGIKKVGTVYEEIKKKEEPKPLRTMKVSQPQNLCHNYAVMATVNLDRIQKGDPQGRDALLEVLDYINQRLEKEFTK